MNEPDQKAAAVGRVVLQMKPSGNIAVADGGALRSHRPLPARASALTACDAHLRPRA